MPDKRNKQPPSHSCRKKPRIKSEDISSDDDSSSISIEGEGECEGSRSDLLQVLETETEESLQKIVLKHVQILKAALTIVQPCLDPEVVQEYNQHFVLIQAGGHLDGAIGLFSVEVTFVHGPAFEDMSQSRQSQMKANLSSFDRTRRFLLTQCIKLHEIRITPPTPSQYAQRKHWTICQQTPTAILCLRPTIKQGLPLPLLHPVFAYFNHQVDLELPSTELAGVDPDKHLAERVAFDLCQHMGDIFTNEHARRRAFNQCFKPLLGHYGRNYPIVTEKDRRKGYASVIGYYERAAGNYVALVVHKVEAGEGNDAYMQLARTYQMFVSQLEEHEVLSFAHGAPTFLLCIVGPMLLISGGFYDGKSYIVEPLAEPCLMLSDHLDKRRKRLAAQLYALKKAIDRLIITFATTSTQPIPPSVPRVYPGTYIAYHNPNLHSTFHFLRPLRSRSSKPHPLIFIAQHNNQFGEPQAILVKLVQEASYGGTQVHQILANSGWAPVLYGFARACQEGLPAACIMQYLAPPNTEGEPGWITLFDMTSGKKLSPAHHHPDLIWSSLDTILNILSSNGIVHGDLRSNNIMVYVGVNRLPQLVNGRVVLKVLDFNWAGRSGEVRYPVLRNEELEWPGRINELITPEMDRKLVTDWWAKLTS